MEIKKPSPPVLQPGDRLLDLKDVQRIVPLSTSGIYARMRAGEFPVGIRIGPNRVAWLESEVLRSVNAMIEAGLSRPGLLRT